MQIVPDASFVIWSISAPGAEMARRASVQEFAWQFDPIAPAHLLFEVGSAVGKQHLNIPVERRAQVHRALLAGVRLEMLGSDALEAIHTLTRKHTIGFYDAVYIWLAAQTPDRALLTQDGPMRDVARAELGPERALDASALVNLRRQRGDIPL